MKMVQKKRIEQYLARGHDIRTASERGAQRGPCVMTESQIFSRPVNKKFIL